MTFEDLTGTYEAVFSRMLMIGSAHIERKTSLYTTGKSGGELQRHHPNGGPGEGFEC